MIIDFIFYWVLNSMTLASSIATHHWLTKVLRHHVFGLLLVKQNHRVLCTLSFMNTFQQFEY